MSGSSNFLATATTTNNTDARMALDHSVNAGSGASVNMTSYTQQADAAVLQTLAQSLPDSVNTLAQMGASVLRDAGGSVVNLAHDATTANTKAWDDTLQYGAATVDKAQALMQASMGFAADQIKQGNQIAQQTIAAYTPTDSKNADIAKYAMYALAGLAAVLLLKGKA